MTIARSWSSRLEKRNDFKRQFRRRSFCSSLFVTMGGIKDFFLFHSPKASADTLCRHFPSSFAGFLNSSGNSLISSLPLSSDSVSLVSFVSSVSNATNFAASWNVCWFLRILSFKSSFSFSMSSFSLGERSFSSSNTFLFSSQSSMKGTGSSGIFLMHSATISSRMGFSWSMMYLFFSSGILSASKLSMAQVQTTINKKPSCHKRIGPKS
mmetsp:Transcript_59063/g.157174  ORF Transcript_59063/g.157174 Transcript_59063/m.157174 type:complete len:210 (-) Transcript_59063:6-635(-)